MNFTLRLNRARPKFYIISDNPNLSQGNVDCSLHTNRFALKDDYHRNRKDMLTYVSEDLKYLETLAKTFIIPARQTQFNRENNFDKAPFRRVAVAMNTNSAFTWSYLVSILVSSN